MFATRSEDEIMQFADFVFQGADTDGSGTISWDEADNYLLTADLPEEDKNAVQMAFRYFDLSVGNGDYMLDHHEMMEGLAQISDIFGEDSPIIKDTDAFWAYLQAYDGQCATEGRNRFIEESVPRCQEQRQRVRELSAPQRTYHSRN